MKQLAIPLSHQSTVAKWLVITQQKNAGQVIGYALGHTASKKGLKIRGREVTNNRIHSGFCELGGNGDPPIPATPNSPLFFLA